MIIGGGETFEDNTKINKRILELTNKKTPKVLFIPTASSDAIGYWENFEKHFSKLGGDCDVLFLIRKKLSKKEIENKIINSDAIYVGGGNTLMMMKLWRKLGVDKLLLKAYEKGIVLSGLSAGSICWFKCGTSDSRRFKNPKADLIKVKGLGIINALHCPHYDNNSGNNSGRRKDTKKIMKKTTGVGICIDDRCALEIINDEYKIVKSKEDANSFQTYWKKGKYFENEIISKNKYNDLNTILTQF